jgi:type I restriction enzyme S subunit
LKLIDAITFRNGKKRPLKSGSIPVYGGNGILDYTCEFNQENSVIIGRVGAYCGSVFYEPKQHWVSDNAISAVNKENTDIIYVYYLLKGLNLNKRHIGTGQPLLTQEILNSIEIYLPDLETQRSIAATLSALDAKIAVNTKINHNLEQMARAMFKSWFVDFEPWSGVMPDDWEEAEFSSFLTSRVEKSNDPTIPLFSITDTGIHSRDDMFNKKLSKADTKNKLIYETDIIFGMSRKILNWGIMRSPIGGVSSAYNVYSVNKKINSKYLESYIKANSIYFRDLIRPSSREGQSVDKEALMMKIIYMPSDNVINKFYVTEDLLTTKIQQNSKEIDNLINIRDSILPKLMSGEIGI